MGLHRGEYHIGSGERLSQALEAPNVTVFEDLSSKAFRLAEYGNWTWINQNSYLQVPTAKSISNSAAWQRCQPCRKCCRRAEVSVLLNNAGSRRWRKLHRHNQARRTDLGRKPIDLIELDAGCGMRSDLDNAHNLVVDITQTIPIFLRTMWIGQIYTNAHNVMSVKSLNFALEDCFRASAEHPSTPNTSGSIRIPRGRTVGPR